jgi:murein DD-endopeptidase MepM/ murein hydrolase activator NlpD
MRARPAALTLLVVTSLVLGLFSPAQASNDKARKHAVDAHISSLHNQLDETSRSLVRAAASLRRARSRLPAARARVARVQGQLAAAEARDRLLASRLATVQEEVAQARARIGRTVAAIRRAHVIIGQIARASYQQGGQGLGPISVVLKAQSPGDFATRIVMVQDAMRSQATLLDGLAADHADLVALKATLDAKVTQLATMKAAQERLVTKIIRLERRAEAAQQAVQALIRARASALATVRREKGAEKRRLARARAESARLARRIAAAAAAAARAARRARLAALRRARQSHSAPPPPAPSGGGGSLYFPAHGPITTYAGYRINPVTGQPSCHSGIDIGPGFGAPIYAAASGTVIATVSTSWDGLTTIIAHGGGMTTWYAHQNYFGVRVGQHVSRGQVIGHVGQTGLATGPHLHFNVVLGTTAMDPMGWFGGPRRTVASLCPNGPAPVL